MNNPSILLADPLAEAGLEILRQSGAVVHQLTEEERPDLANLVKNCDALIVRSATNVDAQLLSAGSRLRVVGRAGIGVDNVDVAAATERGILVVNAPTANLTSATEHTFALLLTLLRNVSLAHDSVRAGEWQRKRFQGTELQGKTLGIIGLGRIGQNVALRARAFGMTVIAFDPFLDASAARRFDVEMMPLEQVLSEADVVTLHTPLTEHTRNLISRERIALMKPGSFLVNCARGGIVDEEALLEALDGGQLGGAALDVFAQEPPDGSRLSTHPKVLATPHIGAQTREAQERVATETARMVLDALAGSLSVTAVNLPFVAARGVGEPFMVLGEQLGRFASSLLGGSLVEVQVELWGVDESVRIPTTIAALKGALMPFLGEAVNFVNAEKVAESRSIEVVRSIHHDAGEYPHLIRVRLKGESGAVEVSGTVFGDSDPRVVQFEGYRLEFRPQGNLLILRNKDVPGVVGRIGTLLGEAGVNIAEIHLARQTDDGDAMAVLRLDEPVASKTLALLMELPEVHEAQMIDLGDF
jgi:D-3-phosphoglycerate dehydrogenase